MYLYIHIPFCASRCIYCDFYVVLEKYGGQHAYIDALLREIDLRFSTETEALTPLQSVYIGGGTPSLLQAEDYRKIFHAITHFTPIAPDAEITFEANPKHVRDNPAAYREAGFNRVSIGVQSFHDGELKRLSRMHTASEAVDCVDSFQKAGFQNISIDLMYGLPCQTQQSWQKTLEQAVTLDVTHISMYGLKVEEFTPLEKLSKTALYTLPQDETTVKMYYQALGYLEAKGFYRYEFSNLSKSGFASRHNLNYWNHQPFWALGASAHGYVNNMRYENVRDMAVYLNNPLAGEIIPVSPQEQLENKIIFGLRKSDGIHIPAIEQEFNISFRQRYQWILEKYHDMGFFIQEHDTLKLSVEAIPVSNNLLAEFIEA